jgi:hypothetical protein
VAGIAFEVNISSSDDFSVSSEIIDTATEDLAVPAAYPFSVRRIGYMTGARQKGDAPFAVSLCHMGREARSRHEAPILIAPPF